MYILNIEVWKKYNIETLRFILITHYVPSEGAKRWGTNMLFGGVAWVLPPLRKVCNIYITWSITYSGVCVEVPVATQILLNHF